MNVKKENVKEIEQGNFKGSLKRNLNYQRHLSILDQQDTLQQGNSILIIFIIQNMAMGPSSIVLPNKLIIKILA